MVAPVFGYVGDAAADRLRRRFNPDCLTTQEDFSRVRGSEPENRPSQFRAAGPNQSGQPDDLSRSHGQIHARDTCRRATKISQLQHEITQLDG